MSIYSKLVGRLTEALILLVLVAALIQTVACIVGPFRGAK